MARDNRISKLGSNQASHDDSEGSALAKTGSGGIFGEVPCDANRDPGSSNGFGEGQIGGKVPGLDPSPAPPPAIPIPPGGSAGPNPWDRIGAGLDADAGSWGIPSDPARHAFPILWALLTDRKFPSGRSREAATISIFMNREGAMVTIRDSSIGYQMRCQADTLQEAFGALEAALVSPIPPWMPLSYGEAFNERRSAEKEHLKKLGSTGRPGKR
jgi:hypothetical protein